MQTHIKTLVGENGELYTVTDGYRILTAKCSPQIDIYEHYNSLEMYGKDRFCPVYRKDIDFELCYESALCLGRFFKAESVSELSEIKDIEAARIICGECPYSNME